MTILDTPKELTDEEIIGYLRHCVEGIENGEIGLTNIDWTVSPMMHQDCRVSISFSLIQMITGKERRRISDNKP